MRWPIRCSTSLALRDVRISPECCQNALASAGGRGYRHRRGAALGRGKVGVGSQRVHVDPEKKQSRQVWFISECASGAWVGEDTCGRGGEDDHVGVEVMDGVDCHREARLVGVRVQKELTAPVATSRRRRG